VRIGAPAKRSSVKMRGARRTKIRLEGLTKTYQTEQGDRIEVLRGVEGEIYDQEFVSLIGPSGCGKTTLLNLVAGLISPTDGRVLVDGHPVISPGRDRGVVFQQDAILPWRTVIRNVEYGLELGGVDRVKRREVALGVLRVVGLESFADFYPKELSGGMKKRVALAAVFANNPEVLLMDEPFGSLDYPTKLGLQRELLAIWDREQKTTVFVTHDLEEALFLSDRVVALARGVIESVVEVPFPRPRTDDLRVSPEFQEMKKVLWKYLG
jgi:NitT/TauT family transport system ATP-binding protein